jgi:hypothetical protein
MRAMQKRSIALHEFHVKRRVVAAMVGANNDGDGSDDRSA